MPKTTFEGKNVVITGAGSGIGRAAALQVADKGGRLLLTDVNAAGLDETVALVTAAQGTVLHHEAFDISNEDAVMAFAQRGLDAAAAVDIVMNIAGISTWGRIQDLQPQHWRDCVEVDLMGPIHVMSAFVPAMIEAGNGGHVVNVSSALDCSACRCTRPTAPRSSASGASARCCGSTSQRHGIGVTLVCPGAVDTPLVGTVDHRRRRPERSGRRRPPSAGSSATPSAPRAQRHR